MCKGLAQTSPGFEQRDTQPINLCVDDARGRATPATSGVSADRTFAARKVTAQNRDDKNVRRGVPSSDGVGRRRTGQRMREDAAAEETKEATDRAANAAATTDYRVQVLEKPRRGEQWLSVMALVREGQRPHGMN